MKNKTRQGILSNSNLFRHLFRLFLGWGSQPSADSIFHVLSVRFLPFESMTSNMIRVQIVRFKIGFPEPITTYQNGSLPCQACCVRGWRTMEVKCFPLHRLKAFPSSKYFNLMSFFSTTKPCPTTLSISS